ncbi:MAG: hypothetical protein KGL39_28215 [Patescibacteria group bacterium]|nr:hypothetical protein [Patescibacteria group bacterium]
MSEEKKIDDAAHDERFRKMLSQADGGELDGEKVTGCIVFVFTDNHMAGAIHKVSPKELLLAASRIDDSLRENTDVALVPMPKEAADEILKKLHQRAQARIAKLLHGVASKLEQNSAMDGIPEKPTNPLDIN